MGRRQRRRNAELGLVKKPKSVSIGELSRLTELVSQYFEAEPECIRATALLIRTAALAGVTLEPRGVALAALGPSGDAAVLGTRAAVAFGPPQPDGLNGWQGAGHVIALRHDPAQLLDPSLPQISERVKAPTPALTVALPAVAPPDGAWDVELGATRLRYYLVDDDNSWQGRYAEQYEQCVDVAADMLGVWKAGPGSTFEKAASAGR
jgi:hypothetical protein